ncbi:hypothetical protein AB0F52_17635 [Amycolatopsis sp. NPDC024027]|uniref:hypothetical protein n=1 Tax=Amycolatopsis sp. NPDC024027 TaxID=3154327 RepID=UPI0033CF5201
MVGRSAMYHYNGGENTAAVACPKAVANDKPAPGGPAVLSAGSQFCVRTSGGKVGCDDVKISRDHTGYIVLDHRLFTTA